jgi:hypothetical protein
MHQRGIHRGSEKRRDPFDSGMGNKIPIGRNPLVPKVQNKVAKGVINKLQEMVKNWTYRTLNLARRLILTKTVLQAISMYMMSVFPTRKGIIQKIKSIQ